MPPLAPAFAVSIKVEGSWLPQEGHFTGDILAAPPCAGKFTLGYGAHGVVNDALERGFHLWRGGIAVGVFVKLNPRSNEATVLPLVAATVAAFFCPLRGGKADQTEQLR